MYYVSNILDTCIYCVSNILDTCMYYVSNILDTCMYYVSNILDTCMYYVSNILDTCMYSSIVFLPLSTLVAVTTISILVNINFAVLDLAIFSNENVCPVSWISGSNFLQSWFVCDDWFELSCGSSTPLLPISSKDCIWSSVTSGCSLLLSSADCWVLLFLSSDCRSSGTSECWLLGLLCSNSRVLGLLGSDSWAMFSEYWDVRECTA